MLASTSMLSKSKFNRQGGSGNDPHNKNNKAEANNSPKWERVESTKSWWEEWAAWAADLNVLVSMSSCRECRSKIGILIGRVIQEILPEWDWRKIVRQNQMSVIVSGSRRVVEFERPAVFRDAPLENGQRKVWHRKCGSYRNPIVEAVWSRRLFRERVPWAVQQIKCTIMISKLSGRGSKFFDCMISWSQ